MARPPTNKRQPKLKTLLVLQQITTTMLVMVFGLYYFLICVNFRPKIREIKTKEEKRIERENWMLRLTKESDVVCISELRMDRATFTILCNLVRDNGGLKATRNTSIEEIVAMFLYTLAHHKKSRTIGHLFFRSRETVSRQFHRVLCAILRLHHVLMKKPEPITQDCQDDRWKFFQVCKVDVNGMRLKIKLIARSNGTMTGARYEQNHKNAKGLWNFKFPYLHKLDQVWGKDRGMGLNAEDISQACEDIDNNKNTMECSSSDSEDVVMVPDTQPSTTKKRKKLSPKTEGSHKKKKSLTSQQTMDERLDLFASDFKSVCGEMASKIGVATDALIEDANKSETVTDDKMLEVMNKLLNMEISHFDVGKVVEAFYKDPIKVKTLFTLPSYMRRSYILGLLNQHN